MENIHKLQTTYLVAPKLTLHVHSGTESPQSPAQHISSVITGNIQILS